MHFTFASQREKVMVVAGRSLLVLQQAFHMSADTDWPYLIGKLSWKRDKGGQGWSRFLWEKSMVDTSCTLCNDFPSSVQASSVQLYFLTGQDTLELWGQVRKQSHTVETTVRQWADFLIITGQVSALTAREALSGNSSQKLAKYSRWTKTHLQHWTVLYKAWLYF